MNLSIHPALLALFHLGSTPKPIFSAIVGSKVYIEKCYFNNSSSLENQGCESLKYELAYPFALPPLRGFTTTMSKSDSQTNIDNSLVGSPLVRSL